MGTLVAVLLACAAGSDTVLLDFYSDTCAPCRQMAPVLERFVAAGYPVRKVNVSQEPALAKRFRVEGVPCCVMLVAGREVDRVSGPVPAERIAQMFALAAPAPSLRGTPVQLASTPASPGAARAIPAVQSREPFMASGATGVAADAAGPTGSTAPDAPADAPSAAQADPRARLLAATVRLRVADPKGFSRGTGTVIDAREDRALVLTCGHLFRDSNGRGEIEVELFGGVRVERVPGRLVHYDLDRDVALLAIPATGPMQVARVAPPGFVVRKGDRVYNVGCNDGADPTVRDSHITGIDRFVGAPNIEASGAPVQGRSGGGLFSADGYLIGVCNAAVPTDNEGMYASYKTVHTVLEQKQLGYVCTEPRGANAAGLELVRDIPPMPTKMTPGDIRPPTNSHEPGAVDPSAGNDRAGPPPRPSAGPRALSPDERAALDLIAGRKAKGDEVICIIRSREQPRAASEIVVIDNASAAFVDVLTKGGAARREATEDRSAVSAPRGSRPAAGNAEPPAWEGRPEADAPPPTDQGRTLQPARGSSTNTASASEQSDWQPRWLQRASAQQAGAPAGRAPVDPRITSIAATAP